MCYMWIPAVISIVSTVMSAQDQAKQADKQNASIARNYELQTASLNQQNQQLNQQAQENMSQRAKESLVEEGRLRAAMGESGLQSGGTDQRILDESGNNATTDISTIENNRLKSSEQLHTQGMGLQASAQSAYNSVRQPSLIGTGLQIAGDVAKVWKPTPEGGK